MLSPNEIRVRRRPAIWLALAGVLLGIGVGLALTQWNAWQRTDETYAGAPGELIEVPCWFSTLPVSRTRCGWLTTEIRDSAGEPALLPVVILRRHWLRPSPRATVYVMGGPGGDSYLHADGVDHWRDWRDASGLDHDLVLYDQRGTGAAWPRIECPAMPDLFWQQLDSDGDIDRLWQDYEAVLLDCAAQVSPIDRARGLYSTATAAADLRVLVDALVRQRGYAAVGVYAASYGSRVAVEAFAEHPHAVDAVVLDSAYPAGADPWIDFADDLDAILKQLVTLCRAAPPCTSDDDLAGLLGQALAEVQRAPPRLQMGGDWLETPQPVRVDAVTLLGLVEHALYADLDVFALPQRLAEAADGRLDLWHDLVESWLFSLLDPTFNNVTYALVECRDNPPLSPSVDAAMRARHPLWDVALRSPLASFSLCERLGVTPRPLSARALPQPTLLLAAELDPRTPPHRAIALLQGFPQMQTLRFPRAGHAIVEFEPCAAQAMAAFLNSAGRAPLPDCATAHRAR